MRCAPGSATPSARGLARGLALAAAGLLLAVWGVALLDSGYQQVLALRPPFAVGDRADVLNVLASNLLVLALHAMACVAGFIAGSALPMQAADRQGVSPGCTNTAGGWRSCSSPRPPRSRSARRPT